MARQHISSADGLGPCWCRPKLVVPGNAPEYRELQRIVCEATQSSAQAALAELMAKFTITTRPEVESYERG